MPTRPDVAARESASRAKRHPLETLGRVGYAVKGVVYALLGGLALQAAFGDGDPEGSSGAFATVAETSFGSVLLTIIAIGLAAYALWRIALAFLDPEGEGTDAEGLARRAFYLVSAASYLGLAYAAYSLISGGGSSGGGTEERTATVFSLPFGRWLVGLAALGILAYGGYQFVRAYKASFMDKFDLTGTGAKHRDLVRRAGQAGLSARGVVYLIVGVFLGRAALQYDADEALGLDGALSVLQSQPYGAFLLGAVAIGLVGYAVYCWTNARYRRFEGNQ